MATQAPNDYKDPYWASLSSSVEQKLDLPSGLLNNIVTRGERSNADQVSEAKAKTVYQITPTTRKLVLEKYGIDAYLNPENAAEAAGLLLKESLDRNQGDVATAVSEYHGGTDRANWGPRTRAYVGRVMSAQRQAAPAQQGQSTFQRVQAAQQPAIPTNAIAQVYEAYKGGQMTPEEAAEFEADVNSGLVMLPRGATLAGQESRAPTEAPAAVMLPPEVTDAYQTGKMSEQERADLEADLQAGLVQLSASPTTLPTFEEGAMVQEQPGIIPRQPDPTLGQQIVGAGETALATATGATGGALGMIGGTLEALPQQIISGQFGNQEAADLVEQTAMKRAQQFTFEPRTQAGQQQLQALGELTAPLVAATPFTAELGAITQGARAAAPAVRAAAQPVIQAGQQAAQAAVRPIATAAQKVRNVLPARTQAQAAAPSAGAAATELETVRRAKAEGLPVPMRLTSGEAARDPDQLRFEKDVIMTPEGALLRQHVNDSNMQALQNFEALVDITGAETPDLISSGNKAIDALSKGWKNAKAETNAAYAAARKSPEAQNPVDVLKPVTIGEGDSEFSGTLIDYLNSRPKGVPSSAVTDSSRQIMKQLGLAKEDADGNLVASPATVAQMEGLRKEISGIANRAEPGQIRDETILKKIIDAQVEPVAGDAFKKAKALRTQQARKYENRSIVANLITNRRGMDDPKVAADQVLNKSILNASPDEVNFLKRVMLTSGDDGKQAWKDIQGALVNHIKEEATKGMGLDANDQPKVSTARLNDVINQLDRNERLDIVIGKENANRVRDLRDVMQYLNTVPPGTLINNSGTKGAIMAALIESALLGSTAGVPIPVLTTLKFLQGEIKNAKIRSKVKQALEGHKKEI